MAKGSDNHLDLSVTLDGETTVIREEVEGKKEIKIKYHAKGNLARIRIDRISAHTPYIYEIKVK